MKKLIKLIPKKAGLLIIILVVQQVSLVFSYSIEKLSLSTEKSVIQTLPFFVESKNDGIKSYKLHPYFQDDIERAMVLNASTPERIMTNGLRSEKFLAYFISQNNPKIDKQRALELAGIYIDEAGQEGVNHDIAFAQMCLETGFLKFNGSVKPWQNNFCGLGATSVYEKGDSFNSIRMGIRAHIQHLKAYADNNEIKTSLVDTRFNYIRRGSAKTISELTGKWAEDVAYGDKINRLLTKLYAL